jgi:GTA TIM-barrel-like domain/Putative phage tail protein
MATLLLGAAGAALGGIFGPTAAIIGQAIGALAGNMVDNALLTPRRSVSGPRLSTVSPFTAEEGTPIPRIYGAARVPGTLIWSTRLEEITSTSRQGGKSLGGGTKVTKFSYFGSVAFALCEGEIGGIRRIWADGQELDQNDLAIRVYTGSETQLPDPLLLAKQGAGNAPAYRGIAYVVIERLALERFGNRIPQLQFEVLRPVGRLEKSIRAVTLIPGATEFGYEPNPVTWEKSPGETLHLNRNVLHSETDWNAAIDELQMLCPNLEHVALVSAWFGDDLRAGNCKIRPGVTTNVKNGVSQSWSCSGVVRTAAREVTRSNGVAAYGGTPDDAGLVHAIRDLKARGLKVTLYPFVMIDIAAGNALPSPYGGLNQQTYPWRGRITCDPAEGQAGSVNGTATALTQVTAFLGAATPAQFVANGDAVTYTGLSTEWGYRRFILHHAHLASRAGGVDAFLVGSEMPGLTRVRGVSNSFPFVSGLMQLATDVRALLGATTKLTYAADWAEYFGYAPPSAPGDLFYNLDPLWAHAAIDAIGIDWYQPITDWRDSQLQVASPDGAVSPHDASAMKVALTSGENFDWYYASAAARQNGTRTTITDGAVNKPWVWRSKDIRSWWSNPHYNRIGGVEQGVPTAWVPKSKPIWFTEIGCPAIDKGANQPNVFSDPKSAESAVPYFSSGARDDLQQRLYLETHLASFDPLSDRFDANLNPTSNVYSGRMLDAKRSYLWAYDTRPFPAFPREADLWDDGENWRTGHWLNGRLGSISLADLVQAIIKDHGLNPVNTSQLSGWMHGFAVLNPQSVRETLEPLLELFGAGWRAQSTVPESFSLDVRPNALRAISDIVGYHKNAEITRARSANNALPTELVFSFADPIADYQNATVSARVLGNSAANQTQISLPIVLDGDTANSLANKWLRRAREEAETLRCSLPPEHADLEVGDCISVAAAGAATYRIERITYGDTQAIEARKAKTYPLISTGKSLIARKSRPLDIAASGRANIVVMDLPGPVVQNGLESPVVRVAAFAKPWKRQLVLASQDQGDVPIGRINEPAIMGEIVVAAADNCKGRRSGKSLTVRLYGGALQSVSMAALLSGANIAAIKSTSGAWEIVQFQTAEEISAQTWKLTGLLRGQRGTQDAMLAGMAVGAPFIILDGAVTELSFAGSFSAARSLRVGPAGKSVIDASWQTVSTGTLTRSVSPLAPEQLRVKTIGTGQTFQWIRCGRSNADDWDLTEIPLGETSESYTIRIVNGLNVTVRTATPATPEFTYLTSQRLADLGAANAPFKFRVKQNSALPGLGLEAELQIT